jgi:hypothetical protein
MPAFWCIVRIAPRQAKGYGRSSTCGNRILVFFPPREAAMA